MSRAFVNEDLTPPEPPPERQVSEHRNLVTREGLTQIEETIARLQAALVAKPDPAAKAILERDLRYWRTRHGSAELVPPRADMEGVGFGSRVTLSRDGGAEEVLHIVGEDEADPARGKISYVSPLALALTGAAAGDELTFTARDTVQIEIVKVENG